MSRTLIDVDDDTLARAASVLGTATKVETVNRALQLVAQSGDRQTEQARFDEPLDLIGDRLAETDVRAARDQPAGGVRGVDGGVAVLDPQRRGAGPSRAAAPDPDPRSPI